MVKELDKRSDYPKAFWYMYSIIRLYFEFSVNWKKKAKLYILGGGDRIKMSLSVKYYPVKSSLKKLKTFQINFLIQYNYYLHDNVLKVKMCSLIVMKYCNVFKKKNGCLLSMFQFFLTLIDCDICFWYYSTVINNKMSFNETIICLYIIRAFLYPSRKLQLKSTFLNKILS